MTTLNYNRYLAALLAAVLIPLGFLVAFNLFFDANHIFASKGYYESMVREMGDPSAKVYIKNFDYKLLQKERIRLAPVAETVVIGNSRIMSISKDVFGHGSFSNHWMPNATLDDLKGLLGCYAFYKRDLPRNVFISLDPLVFNSSENPSLLAPWAKYFPEYRKGRDIKPVRAWSMRFAELQIDKWPKLISFEIFKLNFLVLSVAPKLKERGADVISQLYEDKMFTISGQERFSADGSVILHEEKALDSSKSIEQIRAILREPQEVRNFTQTLSPQTLKEFEEFIMRLKETNVHVYLILVPYHPYFYDALNKYPQSALVLVEEYTKEMAQEYDIKTIGTFNPYNLSWGPDAFLDVSHPKPSFMQELIRSSLSGHAN